MSDNKQKDVKSTECGAEKERNNCQMGAADRRKRRSLWTSTFMSLQYISSLPRDQFRMSDKVSDVLVLICLFLAIIIILLPPSLLKPPLVVLADCVFLAVITFFIMKRMGILTTLSMRQAVLVWDIVIGSLLLGTILTFNVLYLIAFLHR